MKPRIMFPIIALLLVSFAACGAESSQIFKFNIDQEPTILDPFQYRDDKASAIVMALHEPLIRISGENGKDWEPGLATDIRANADSTIYTVTLRDDALWSDGAPITAEDVVFSFQRAVDPAFASEKAFDYYIFANAREIVEGSKQLADLGVKATGANTIEFTLTSPMDYFPDFLKLPGFSPVQKAAAEKFGNLYGASASNMVFSGPFILADWQHETSITLKKNDNYWDAANVKLQTLEISLATDSNTINGMYMTDDLDFLEVKSDMKPLYANDPSFKSMMLTRVDFIEFNPQMEFLGNKKIREALSMTFDRLAYATSILGEPDIAAYGLVPFGIRGKGGGDFREQAGSIVQDLASDPEMAEQAVRLFEEGLAEIGKTRDEMRNYLEILCVDSPSARNQAQAIQAMWRQYLNVNLPVTPMQVRMLIPMLMDGTFKCVVGGGRTALTSDSAYFIDFIYYENKWADEHFRAEMEKTFKQTGDERIQTLMALEKYVLENFVYIPQVYQKLNYVTKDGVEGLRLYPYGPMYDFKYVSISR